MYIKCVYVYTYIYTSIYACVILYYNINEPPVKQVFGCCSFKFLFGTIEENRTRPGLGALTTRPDVRRPL